ncbi:MAG: hypothetical protein KDJ41_05505, partial [Hyphomicrobiaceae bacterium]|nr:hypothetical protein [Hyphomicrobiaceae bacterium]
EICGNAACSVHQWKNSVFDTRSVVCHLADSLNDKTTGNPSRFQSLGCGYVAPNSLKLRAK